MAEGTEPFDAIVIGGGQAGIPLAWALAKAGKRVALIERKQLGGSCVNFGCTPTKAAIASARVAHLARRAAVFGVRTGEVVVDFAAVIRRAREVAAESRTSLEHHIEGATNPRLIRGHARLAGRTPEGLVVAVGDQRLIAAHMILNTGTRTLLPELPGLDAVDVITAGNWLDHDRLPEHLVVIGGGYIGIEMAQFYRRMGSRVTVLARSPVLAREDRDVADAIRAFLELEGVTFRVGVHADRVERAGDGLRLRLAGSGQSIDASHLFVAIGRRYNTDDLGLETVGVARDDSGAVVVDERLATSVPGVWAAGDMRGGPQFTHTSWDDYRVLQSQLIGDRSRTTRRIVPYGVFTDPELGRVGITEDEARSSGREVRTARFEMKRNGKAREIGEPNGFIKVVIDANTKHVLGAAVLAAEGAELVHLYITLMNANAPYTVMRDAVHIHPTLSEAVQSAVAELG